MKKTTKGAIAAAASASLLLGGAGSLAYWNTTDGVTAGSFSTGDLVLDAAACDTAGWTVTNTVEGVTDQPVDLTTFEVVPGDVFTKECTIAVTAVGDNLRAILDITGGEDTVDLAADGDPAIRTQDYTITPTFVLDGPETITPGTPFTLDSGDDTKDIAVTLTVDFPLTPDGALANNDSKLDIVTLAAYTVTATQARTAAP